MVDEAKRIRSEKLKEYQYREEHARPVDVKGVERSSKNNV